jgi:hypothetical protein
MAQFVAPTGYVELDNDCEYSLDRKSTRSREEVNPKEDLAFYFNTYIVPKYGLNNINISNVASFMKDLEMNWTKLTPEMKSKVMDILVDGILNKEGSFRTDLLQKLNIPINPVQQTQQVQQIGTVSKFGKSNLRNVPKKQTMLILIIVAIGGYFLFKKKRVTMYGRLS